MRTRSVLLGLLAAVSWGTVYPVGKHLVASGSDPLWIAFARYAFALPLMLPLVLRKGTRGRLARALTPRGVLAAVFLGATGILAMAALSALSWRYPAAAVSAIVMTSNPLIARLLATVGGEALTRRTGLAAGLGCAGVGMVILGSGGGKGSGAAPVLGAVLALGAAASWSLYTVFGKAFARKAGGLASTFLAMAAGGVLFLPLLLILRTPVDLRPATVALLFYKAAVPTALGFWAWFTALEELDAGTLAAFQFATPAVACVLGWIFLSEVPGTFAFLGFAVITAGLFAAVRSRA